MSLNPVAANYNWNYSNTEKPGYSDVLIGTVLAIQEVQATKYRSTDPDFWPDGNPKLNIRMAFADQNGMLKTFTFQPANKDAKRGLKKSVHMDLFHLTGDTDMTNLIGKTIKIQTWPVNPSTNAPWGTGNPRLFDVSLVDGEHYDLLMPAQLPHEYSVPVLLADKAVSGGQVIQQGVAPQQIQQPVYQQPVYAQPQQMYAQPQPMMQQPVMAQPVAQPMVPAGMDPQIAAAMMSVGATNIQPMAAEPSMPVSVYDEEIPI